MSRQISGVQKLGSSVVDRSGVSFVSLPQLTSVWAAVRSPVKTPCGPILSMKELAEEPSLRETGTVVEVDHPERGKYLTVGNPIKLSDSPADVDRSPLLGEHTDEILNELGLSDTEIEDSKAAGAV